MRVVGFVGSPRIEGNTNLLVDEVLKGAASTGAEIESYVLNYLEIAPCQACKGCRPDGKCSQSDDMQLLYRELADADALVVGSPIYMGQMAAQMKTFLDRLYAFYVSGKCGKKPVIMVFTHGAQDRKTYAEYIEYTGKVFEFLGYDIHGTVIAANMSAPGEVLKQPVVLEEAYNLGTSVFN